jgi:hypothetical protein
MILKSSEQNAKRLRGGDGIGPAGRVTYYPRAKRINSE